MVRVANSEFVLQGNVEERADGALADKKWSTELRADAACHAIGEQWVALRHIAIHFRMHVGQPGDRARP